MNRTLERLLDKLFRSMSDEEHFRDHDYNQLVVPDKYKEAWCRNDTFEKDREIIVIANQVLEGDEHEGLHV